jgi:hypothetical protein
VADKTPLIADNPKAALALLSGFATAIVAAVLRDDQFKSWGSGHIVLVVMPLLGSLASTFLVQSRVAEIEALREKGRETIQRGPRRPRRLCRRVLGRTIH